MLKISLYIVRHLVLTWSCRILESFSLDSISSVSSAYSPPDTQAFKECYHVFGPSRSF